MIPLLAFVLLQGVDEAVFAQAAVPLPRIAHADGSEAWDLYTERANPEDVEQAIARKLDHRSGWHRDGATWKYSARGREAPSPPKMLSVTLWVLPGRAMRSDAAVPQRELWTTVLVTITRSMFVSGPGVAYDWVSATRPEDDERMENPVGEEKELTNLLQTRPVTHGSKFGRPWWQFTLPGTRKEIEEEVGRTLKVRKGWLPSPWTGESDGVSVKGTNWVFSPTETGAKFGSRELNLDFHEGKAMPQPSETPLDQPWTTMLVIASAPTLTEGPIGAWQAYPGLGQKAFP